MENVPEAIYPISIDIGWTFIFFITFFTIVEVAFLVTRRLIKWWKNREE